jgi:RsiW-degrading membrane proteinase PrsW (M82 family)
MDDISEYGYGEGMCVFYIKPLIILASFVLLWFGAKGLREGRVLEEGNEIIVREKEPINYWMTVVMYMGGGIAGILFSLICL